MQIPGSYIVTALPPQHYTDAQIVRVTHIAHLLNRGKFILTEPPGRF